MALPDKVYALIAWGGRAESPEDLAQRTSQTIRALDVALPGNLRWSRLDGPLPWPSDVSEGAALVAAGGFTSDRDGRSMPEMGYSFGFSAWAESVLQDDGSPSAGQKPLLTATISAGRARGVTGSYANTILIESTGTADAFASWNLISQALVAVVDVWAPDWGMVSSRGVRKAQARAFAPNVGAGAVTWIRYEGADVPALETASVSVASGGLIVAVGVGDPVREDLPQRVAEVRNELDSRGLLPPIPEVQSPTS